MSNIITFTNENFGEIRSTVKNGVVWFVAKDVATALGYANPQKAIRTHVDIEDKGVNEMVTPGGKQKLPIINESGLYAFIFGSKLEKAKIFKRWVTSEVLPQIRKTGGYIPISNVSTADEIQANAAMIANNTIKLITDELSLLQVKADYFDQLVDANLLTNFRDTAKELGLMESYFISLLEFQGYIYRDKAKNIRPTSLSMKQGLMQVKEYFKNTSDYGLQALITPRGRETFRLLFQNLKTNASNTKIAIT